MSSIDLMADDILLEIFDYLDEEDLINCEKVCTGWKCLIGSFFTPTRLYERKMRLSEMWQKYLKVRARNQVIPQIKYPKLKIAGEVMCLEKNWQTWNYQLRKYLFNQELRCILELMTFVMDDDYLFWKWLMPNGYELNCTIIDRKTMTVKCRDGNAFFKARAYCEKIHNHMIVASLLNSNSFSFLDVNTGQQVKEISGEFGKCCFGNCGLFLVALDHKLKIWRMNTALDMELVQSFHFPTNLPNQFLGYEITEMDDEYIAVLLHESSDERRSETERWCTIYFVSTETLQIERSLSITRQFRPWPHYERGFLVIPLTDSIRLVHVASGRCFSVVDVSGRTDVTSNSRYLVIWQEFHRKTVNGEEIPGTKLKLFDLQLLRNASCPDTPPFTEHWVPFATIGCRADETQLVFTCKSKEGELVQLCVFDFSPAEEVIAISK